MSNNKYKYDNLIMVIGMIILGVMGINNDHPEAWVLLILGIIGVGMLIFIKVVERRINKEIEDN